MTRYYAGIGSRATPIACLALFTRIASRLEELEFVLRSGGAKGADSAFEAGVSDPANAKVFLPWAKFNHNTSALDTPTVDAYVMAEEYHPAWHRCGSAARKFHARNCHQILGQHLDTPVDFVVCWTPKGEVTGGTGQALRIAKAHNIPVVNFGSEDAMDKLNSLVDIGAA